MKTKIFIFIIICKTKLRPSEKKCRSKYFNCHLLIAQTHSNSFMIQVNLNNRMLNIRLVFIHRIRFQRKTCTPRDTQRQNHINDHTLLLLPHLWLDLVPAESRLVPPIKKSIRIHFTTYIHASTKY